MYKWCNLIWYKIYFIKKLYYYSGIKFLQSFSRFSISAVCKIVSNRLSPSRLRFCVRIFDILENFLSISAALGQDLLRASMIRANLGYSLDFWVQYSWISCSPWMFLFWIPKNWITLFNEPKTHILENRERNLHRPRFQPQ